MPIRREHRHSYPIDWPQLSAIIRFVRAQSRCEGCGRPHMQDVQHLGDRLQWKAVRWRDGRGHLGRHALPHEGLAAGWVKLTRVVQATAHHNHDTADNADANLAALCQRCHMLRDWPEHQHRRRITLRARRVIGDLFSGIHFCG